MSNNTSGGTKHDLNKPSVTLIPAEYIEGTAQVFNFGAKKYGAHNFRLGINHSRLLDASFRHLLAVSRGEWLDPESGLPHIYHASCSLAMLSYMAVHHPNLNDLYEMNKETTDVGLNKLSTNAADNASGGLSQPSREGHKE